MTQYVVLRQDEVLPLPLELEEDRETIKALTIVGTFEAGSDEAACRAGARDLYRVDRDLTEATLVAVPSRSFNAGVYAIEPEPIVSKKAAVAVAGLT